MWLLNMSQKSNDVKSVTEESVLNNVKKHVQVATDYDVFDTELINHINSALFTLYETITMPKVPFLTSKEDTWSEVIGDETMELYPVIPSYIGLLVKLIFDTPVNSFAIDALERQIRSYEYRMADKDILIQKGGTI